MATAKASIKQTSNFEFLKEHDPVFFQLTNNAERIFAIDPNACLMKLRQFGEALAQDLATQVGLMRTERETQLELLNKLRFPDVERVSLFTVKSDLFSKNKKLVSYLEEKNTIRQPYSFYLLNFMVFFGEELI